MTETLQECLLRETRHARPRAFCYPHGIAAGALVGLACDGCDEAYGENDWNENVLDGKSRDEILEHPAVRKAIECLRLTACKGVVAAMSWEQIWF